MARQPMKHIWELPLAEVMLQARATPAGLTSSEAAERLRVHGRNSLEQESRFATLRAIFQLFTNPLVLILLAAGATSLILGDGVGGGIIMAMVLMSVMLSFYMEYQARHAVAEIQKRVATTAEVLRDGQARELPVAELVPGDIIILNAGDLVPADARLLEEKDLQVREAALTGESLPVEKNTNDVSTDPSNCVFLGTGLQTGIARAVVVATGKDTELGETALSLAAKAPETEFDRGIRKYGVMITRVVLLLVVFVLLVNLGMHRPLLESFLFSIALAVGMTPEMMPMIITITLAAGARRMAEKKVLIKQLAAIEDFGSLTILCSDKTGTLTEGTIVLDRHVDIRGKDDDTVLRYVYLNSYFQAGIKSPIDDAVLQHDRPAIAEYIKVDEIPFDFLRRRLSVVVRHQSGEPLLVTKGEAESIFAICRSVNIDGAEQPFDEARRAQALATFQQLSADGYRTIGVATAKVPSQTTYRAVSEQAMTLEGFAAFLDPPKPGIGEVLTTLKQNGVSVVVMTGDNQYVTRKVARDVGLPVDLVLTGPDVDGMDDAALAVHAEQGAIFARVSPAQKNRVILALKTRGHVVGFIGDGINDAPSLHSADVGISVMNGVAVAKDAAKVILLEKDLAVLNEGILEGRRSFANIMKYIVMGTSSNFGNMFSLAAAALFLPFLPMLPTQILLNNFLYDLSQVSIPSDNVDVALLHVPKRWRIDFITKFMLIIGPISSLYDLLTFGLLFWLFQAATNPPLFRTAWFVESLVTQTLVVFVIRTAGSPFASRPGWFLQTTILSVVAAAVLIPFTPLGDLLGFVPLPLSLLGVIALLAGTYLVLVQAVKSWFYRRYPLL